MVFMSKVLLLLVSVMIALLGMAAVAIGVLAWFRANDEDYPAGSCTRCGYDLTANTSSVCPECGDKIVTIPPNAGQFHLGEVIGDDFTIVADCPGREPVVIHCRNRHQACALCDQLNAGRHGGKANIPR
jgi:hypothetical protein